MSRGTVVAKRYAKALFQLAQEQGLVAEVENKLSLVVATLENDAKIRAFLSAPNIALSAKVAALKSGFDDKASSFVLNTISLLIERGREGEIASVLEAYLQVSGAALGRADAHVTSSTPLTEDEKNKLADKFGKLLGKTVRVTSAVNPDLLGGVTVRIGDTLYDGSLKGKLDRLDKALRNAAI
ncbi:F0F1 ATP synthase subunit delta [Cohnella panacarvi]|uniref:F0F1 ATP synthase subunit delta n=1 Tax=Cohnella panacarvi TaxID=400776 RepID=UPI00047EC184|nr:F0F1 ATP synthase subunit delta [Cohnella panacarvi]